MQGSLIIVWDHVVHDLEILVLQYCLPLLFDILHNHDNASYSVVIVVSLLFVLMNDEIASVACKNIP